MSGLLQLFEQPLVTVLGLVLLHFLWQGAVVAGLLWLSLRVLARRSADARYAASCLALVLMAVAPVVTGLVILYGGPAGPDGAAPGAGGGPAGPGAGGHFHPGPLEPYLPWAVALWAAGSAFLLIRLLRRLGLARRLRLSGTRPAPAAVRGDLEALCRSLGIRRAVEVVESSLAQVPTVVGWLRPFILVPTCALTGLSPDHLRAILAHELAHVRRHDYLVNLLQAVLESLLFYHPAVWWVSARVRLEREHCCDDVAVSACGDVLTYARALAELDRSREPMPQIAIGANGGSLMNRIRRLVDARARVHSRSGGWALSGALALALLALAPVAALAQDAQSDRLCPECSAKLRKMLAPARKTAEAKAPVFVIRSKDGASLEAGRLEIVGNGRLRIGDEIIEYRVVDPQGRPVDDADGVVLKAFGDLEVRDLTEGAAKALVDVMAEPEKVVALLDLGKAAGARDLLAIQEGGDAVDLLAELKVEGADLESVHDLLLRQEPQLEAIDVEVELEPLLRDLKVSVDPTIEGRSLTLEPALIDVGSLKVDPRLQNAKLQLSKDMMVELKLRTGEGAPVILRSGPGPEGVTIERLDFTQEPKKAKTRKTEKRESAAVDVRVIRTDEGEYTIHQNHPVRVIQGRVVDPSGKVIKEFKVGQDPVHVIRERMVDPKGESIKEVEKDVLLRGIGKGGEHQIQIHRVDVEEGGAHEGEGHHDDDGRIRVERFGEGAETVNIYIQGDVIFEGIGGKDTDVRVHSGPVVGRVQADTGDRGTARYFLGGREGTLHGFQFVTPSEDGKGIYLRTPGGEGLPPGAYYVQPKVGDDGRVHLEYRFQGGGEDEDGEDEEDEDEDHDADLFGRSILRSRILGERLSPSLFGILGKDAKSGTVGRLLDAWKVDGDESRLLVAPGRVLRLGTTGVAPKDAAGKAEGKIKKEAVRKKVRKEKPDTGPIV